MHSLLENSLLCILISFVIALLGFLIDPKICFIFYTIFFFILATTLYRNTNFYERYISKFSKNYFAEYLGKDITSKEMMQHKYSLIYYYWSIFGFIVMLCLFGSCSIVYNRYIHILFFKNLFLVFLNSIIGIFFYKRYKNETQYIISCVIYIGLLISFFI